MDGRNNPHEQDGVLRGLRPGIDPKLVRHFPQAGFNVVTGVIHGACLDILEAVLGIALRKENTQANTQNATSTEAPETPLVLEEARTTSVKSWE